MLGHIDLLPPQTSSQLAVIDMHFKAAEEHFPGGHFIHDRVQPIHKQQFVVGRFAGNLYEAFGLEGVHVGDDGR